MSKTSLITVEERYLSLSVRVHISTQLHSHMHTDASARMHRQRLMRVLHSVDSHIVYKTSCVDLDRHYKDLCSDQLPRAWKTYELRNLKIFTSPSTHVYMSFEIVRPNTFPAIGHSTQTLNFKQICQCSPKPNGASRMTVSCRLASRVRSRMTMSCGWARRGWDGHWYTKALCLCVQPHPWSWDSCSGKRREQSLACDPLKRPAAPPGRWRKKYVFPLGQVLNKNNYNHILPDFQRLPEHENS